MKKIQIIILCMLLIQLSSCNKDIKDCDCPKSPLGYVNFSRISHFPINSTVIPRYIANYDTLSFHLHISDRFFVDMPPPISGLDYYRYETDQTIFLCEKFGLFYWSRAGNIFTPPLTALNIDWYGVQGFDTTFQRYSIEFNIPIDSNIFTTEIFIYDSLMVNQEWYTKVLSGPVVKSHQPGLDYFGPIPKRYYYSTEYGIIKFDMSDGTFWEIIGN